MIPSPPQTPCRVPLNNFGPQGKTLLATTALAVSGLAASNALAVDVTLYGQVNKAVAFVDDGTNTDFAVVDNKMSTTRFGVKGSQALDNGLTASVLMETELDNNPSSDQTQTSAGTVANPSSTASAVAGSNTFETRHARVGIAGNFGAVFVGQQSTATDSVSEQDLVGVADVMNSGSLQNLLGGYKIRTTTAGAAPEVTQFLQTNLTSGTAAAAATIGDLVSNLDGNGRQNAVRYDSPIFNGFQGRVSVAQGGDMDLGAYYNGKFDAFTVKGALGYVMFNDADTAATDIVESQLSGSVSVAHDNGIAATLAYGTQDLDKKTVNTSDPSYYYVKLGYAWDAFEVAADYGVHEEARAVATDHEIKTFGLGGQYDMGNGVSVAATYRTAEADVTGINTEDLNLMAVNLRVKF